jgi:hypothetical protein
VFSRYEIEGTRTVPKGGVEPWLVGIAPPVGVRTGRRVTIGTCADGAWLEATIVGFVAPVVEALVDGIP